MPYRGGPTGHTVRNHMHKKGIRAENADPRSVGLNQGDRDTLAARERDEEDDARHPWRVGAVMRAPEWARRMAADYHDDVVATIRTGKESVIALPDSLRLRIVRDGLHARLTLLRGALPVSGFKAWPTADGLTRILTHWDCMTSRMSRGAWQAAGGKRIKSSWPSDQHFGGARCQRVLHDSR